MHALIIEDDPITTMLLEDELRELGFDSVDTAATEEEAISAAAEKCPDLVTSDGVLRTGSGISAIRRICALVSVPVIFITGDPDRARRLMPDAPVVEKPFTIAQLVRAIERVRPLPA